jgi:trans-aconitate methyltransferase
MPPALGSAPNFDPLAKLYRWMEYGSFGPLLERCRFRYRTECRSARSALVLGDGDGRCTAQLLAENPSLQVDAVDASAAMLAELARRARKSAAHPESRLNLHQADIRHFTPTDGPYDLVVSHFFLDCLTDTEVASLCTRVVPHLAPGARWLISEFAVPPQRVRGTLARALIRFLYFAFARMTHLTVQRLPDYARHLQDNGFSLDAQTHLAGGLLVAEVWSLKRSLPPPRLS